jgi:hypothetical protein
LLIDCRLSGSELSTRFLATALAIVLACALLLGAVSSRARPAQTLPAIALPALMLWVAASVCQWKVYGPITGQHLALLPSSYGMYDARGWGFVLVAVVGTHVFFVVSYK